MLGMMYMNLRQFYDKQQVKLFLHSKKLNYIGIFLKLQEHLNKERN